MKHIIIPIDEETNRPVGWNNSFSERMLREAAEIGVDTIITFGKKVDLNDAFYRYLKARFGLTKLQFESMDFPKSFTQYIEEEL